MSPIKPTPPPGSLRAIGAEPTPAHGTRVPQMHLHRLPTDPAERRKVHDDQAAQAGTSDQRWQHTTTWLGILVEQGASTSRVAHSSADYLIEMKADLLTEFGRLSRQDSIHDAHDQEAQSARVEERQAREQIAATVAKHERLLMAKGAGLLLGGAGGIVGLVKVIVEIARHW